MLADASPEAVYEKRKSIFFTLRRRRLAGLVGDGLGDFPDRGVDSWLPAVPLAVNERIKSATAMAAAVVASSALDRVQRAETRANTHLNCWTRGTCSCETSRHTAARSDPAETAGGRMTQTLPPCTLEVDGRRTLSHFYCAEALNHRATSGPSKSVLYGRLTHTHTPTRKDYHSDKTWGRTSKSKKSISSVANTMCIIGTRLSVRRRLYLLSSSCQKVSLK